MASPEPQLLLASTAHPAFTKAAHYLGVEEIRVPVGDDLRADVVATSERIGDRTALDRRVRRPAIRTA